MIAVKSHGLFGGASVSGIALPFRLDTGTLRPPTRLPDGRLRAEGYLTRTGVFEYREPDGTTRREYRPPEEVHHADSLTSFALVPITNNHPTGLLDASNARKHAVGSTGELVRADGAFVAASLMFFDADTIRQVEAGKAQLSCGYTADLLEQPGVTPDGERYDAIQRNIRGNHVAIVDVGRAGPDVRVRMDAAVMVPPNSRQDGAGEAAMNEELKQALKENADLTAKLAAAEKRADAAEAKVGELEKAKADEAKRADKAEGERDTAKADVEKLEKERTDGIEAARSEIKARLQLEAQAGSILGDEVKLDDMKSREIQVAVIKKLDEVEIAEDKSDDYVSARYDSALERAEASSEALAGARRAATPPAGRTDAGDEEAKARASMMARLDKMGTAPMAAPADND